MGLKKRWASYQLDLALRRVTAQHRRVLDDTARFVIFSDHHKGTRDAADDFQACEATYLQALNHYFVNDFSLILLGDADELWEARPPDVVAAYRHVFESEARFHPNRLLRVFGNHDAQWSNTAIHDEYLSPFFAGPPACEGVVFDVPLNADTTGRLFLTHGHQGTLGSDLIVPVSRFFVRWVYPALQKLLRLGKTPAQQPCLRGQHDTLMYEWARQASKNDASEPRSPLILIAGHTHRPVWSSRTHLEKLMHRLMELASQPQTEATDAQLADLRAAMDHHIREHPPCEDTIKTSPCYFNTGCCRFADGDITGIEIDQGRMRLIKWSEEGGRKVLEEASLRALFSVL